MDERRFESLGDTARRRARRMAGEAQQMASRAGNYAQERAQEMANRAGAYAQQRARDANTRLQRLTGRGAESWMNEARRFAQHHPLQAIAVTVAVGFVLGKILARD